MTRVCFVCLGNICRSPIAEIVLRRLVDEAGAAEQISVSSAGTGDWHIGEQADRRTLATLTRHGYDGAAHRARQFTAASFADCDLVVAMDRANVADLRRMAGAAAADIRLLTSFDTDAEGPDIPDPYYGNAADFDRVLAMVERGCVRLLESLLAEPPGG